MERAARTTAETVGYGIGVTAIVVGGLVAAVASPLDLPKGSWLAAYLVLVAGVAQCILARQWELVAAPRPQTSTVTAVTVAWVIGNLATMAGALFAQPLVADVGGALLIVALVLSLLATRHAEFAARVWLMRIIYAILIVSIPIGLVLTHVRTAAVVAG